MNKVILIGNLTRDPESQTTNSGVSFARFSIAVNRNYTNAEGERETDFINVIAWRGLADNVSKYLSKGKKVCVVGSLQTRSYEDKHGEKRYVTEILAEDIEFLSPKEHEDAPAPNNSARKNPAAAPKVNELKPVDNDDELPF